MQVRLTEKWFFLRLGWINYSQEKDLNNLVATRKHQKNQEKVFSSLWIHFYRLTTLFGWKTDRALICFFFSCSCFSLIRAYTKASLVLGVILSIISVTSSNLLWSRDLLSLLVWFENLGFGPGFNLVLRKSVCAGSQIKHAHFLFSPDPHGNLLRISIIFWIILFVRFTWKSFVILMRWILPKMAR